MAAIQLLLCAGRRGSVLTPDGVFNEITVDVSGRVCRNALPVIVNVLNGSCDITI